GLETVACTNRVHDVDRRPLYVDRPGPLVPRLRAAHAARDDEEAGIGRKEHFGPLSVRIAAVEESEVAVGEAHDAGAAGELVHTLDIFGLVANEPRPAIRVE